MLPSGKMDEQDFRVKISAIQLLCKVSHILSSWKQEGWKVFKMNLQNFRLELQQSSFPAKLIKCGENLHTSCSEALTQARNHFLPYDI